MRTFKLTMAYDGTAYVGWQVQREGVSVQGTLQRVLLQITNEPIRVTASGRTDAGVHAIGQVVSFSSDTKLSCESLCQALNAELPYDMAVLRIDDAPQGFHAIRDAEKKRYRYILHDGPKGDIFWRQFCWHTRGPIDAEAMQLAALHWLGKHDFVSFESQGAPRKTSIRTVSDISVCRVEKVERSATFLPIMSDASRFVIFEVEADGFLYNMVRAMMGTLVQVGRNKKPANWAKEVLLAKDRSQAGETAPAQGLFLVQVDY